MLQRHHRLPAKERLIHPRLVRTPHFIIKIAQNGISESRFGFVIRKSQEKRAVKRNRIKRVFRSCIEELLPQIRSGYDMLFLLESSIIETKREDLCNQIQVALQTKQVLKNNEKHTYYNH